MMDGIALFLVYESPVPHRIEYTRNKHSRAVFYDDTVVIRLARGLSERQEREHIEYLLKRMTSVALREQSRTRLDPFRPLLKGDSSCTVTLADETQYTFILLPGSRTRAKRTPEGWAITIGPKMRKKSLHRYLWNILADAEKSRLTDLTVYLNAQTFNFALHSVRTGYASSQWGSCSHRGDIMLNASLLFVPEPLLEYVIIHELAHRQVRNHSKAFWRLVESVMPDYKERRKALQKFRMSTL